KTGTYGVSVSSLTNLDTPYVFFEFGVPELGTNHVLYDLRYVDFRTNLRGSPDLPALADVGWASLESEVNTTGRNLPPAYVFDLATRGFAGLNFTAETYPGLLALLNIDGGFEALRQKIYGAYPQFRGLLDQGPAGLDQIFPGLTSVYQSIVDHFNPLDELNP